MKQLLLCLLNKFIVPQAIHSAQSVVDISNENQTTDDDLTLGKSLRTYLRERDELLGTSDLVNFFVYVRSFLSIQPVSNYKGFTTRFAAIS